MTEQIYRHPEDYDLEHEGDTKDIDFFVGLVTRWNPRNVLELACGSGRVTIPLAEKGVEIGCKVTGLELVPEMLAEAQCRRKESSEAVPSNLTLIEGDMRTWQADKPFDLILSPCSSMCHLLTLEDQVLAWKRAYANLAPGGRFVVDVTMPNLAVYADSFTTPPRSIVEIDRDTTDPETGTRLLRYRTTRYAAHEQRARIRFIYDKFEAQGRQDHFISDYESHVYFPREMELLFLHSGFEIEEIFGDYQGSPLGFTSRQMVTVGIKR
jgi:SAM-dependent methyltransferase